MTDANRTPGKPDSGGTIAAQVVVPQSGNPANPVLPSDENESMEVLSTPRYARVGFWQQPWVQDVLPFVTSVTVHLAVIIIGLMLFGVYKAVVAPPPVDQVIIPESSLATEGPPGGVPNEGAGNNPLQQAMQDKDPDADTTGFAEKKGPNVDLTNVAGATGDSSDTVIGIGPGGGFSKGKGLIGDAGGDNSGAQSAFGVPGGGGLGPKGPVFGNGGNARTIAFVCDGTGSMLAKMPALKNELANVIHNNLKPIQQFNVIFFQEGRGGATALSNDSLLFATPDNKRKFDEFLQGVGTRGETDPLPGIDLAFRNHPNLVYLLTDGEFPNNPAVLERIRKLNADHKTKLNTIAFTNDEDRKHNLDVRFKKFLEELAKENGGTFKDVNADEL
jgi:hypothetical protein